MSHYLSPRYQTLRPYTPGEQPKGRSFIKLNTNESPFPPAPGVMEAADRAAVEGLNLYNDPTTRVLEEAIAEFFGLPMENVIAGNGSDEILAFCFQAFCDAQIGACYPDITYGFYAALTQLYCVKGKAVPLEPDFRVDPEKLFQAGATIFLANPNAPTGLALPLADVERIAYNNAGNVVVVDEAYIDYGGESAVSLIDKYDNLLVVQTFSKSRCMAGARIGFAVGNAALIDDLRKIKFAFHPYNVNTLSQRMGAAAMRDRAYLAMCVETIQATRAEITHAFRARGFFVTDSMTNFVFVKSPLIGGRAFAERLREKGILVRHFPGPRTEDFARITIGSADEMRSLICATDEIMATLS